MEGKNRINVDTEILKIKSSACCVTHPGLTRFDAFKSNAQPPIQPEAQNPQTWAMPRVFL